MKLVLLITLAGGGLEQLKQNKKETVYKGHTTPDVLHPPNGHARIGCI